MSKLFYAALLLLFAGCTTDSSPTVQIMQTSDLSWFEKRDGVIEGKLVDTIEVFLADSAAFDITSTKIVGDFPILRARLLTSGFQQVHKVEFTGDPNIVLVAVKWDVFELDFNMDGTCEDGSKPVSIGTASARYLVTEQ